MTIRLLRKEKNTETEQLRERMLMLEEKLVEKEIITEKDVIDLERGRPPITEEPADPPIKEDPPFGRE